MEELDEVQRRELLMNARAVLEENFQKAQLEHQGVKAQIEAARKELSELRERVLAAEAQAADRLAKLAESVKQEEADLRRRNEGLRIQRQQLTAQHLEAESLGNAKLALLSEQIEGRREELSDLIAKVERNASALAESKRGLADIRESLKAL